MRDKEWQMDERKGASRANGGDPAVTEGAGQYWRSQELFARAVRVIPKGIYGHKYPDFVLPGHSSICAVRAEGGHQRG